MTPRGSLWTLSTRAWCAILAVLISALGGWVGVSAAQFADAPQVATANPAPSAPSSVGTPAIEGAAEDSAAEAELSAAPALALAQPPLLGKTAAEVLALLVVREPDSGADYQRTQQFGEAWMDVDGNGCSTREDILLRDLGDTVLNGCKVMSGAFVDPYSGRAIDFVRGNDTSMLVQIDHVVALYNAWMTGAQHLTQDQRQRLANDPTNLLAVSEATNQSKGAADAATWLPPFAGVHCEYAARQISVKYAYDLWVTSAERDALASVLRACPEQPAYRSGLGSSVRTFGSTPPAATPPAAEPTTPSANVYYENCSAAYAAGVSRIPRGAPGYRPELDRDDDGIACEG